MTRPTLEVADIVRKHGDEFFNRYRRQLSYQQVKALNAIERCRTAALGGHVDECSRCGHTAISYNSCRNRHCPKCQAQARQRWLAAREQELLDTPYFHVVFTLPHALAPLCRTNPEVLYNLLFRTSAQTMLEVAADPKHLGAEIGFLSILHTWGQNLTLHPHVHCIVPAGGFSAGHDRWIRPRYPFFLPVKVLSRVFRGKFVEGLKRAYRSHVLRLIGAAGELTQRSNFEAFVNGLFRQDWVVYAKPSMGGPVQALRYLGRYTHRVAISNHRLLAFDGDRVTFRWKDYAHGNKQRRMTLTATEFLRRFLQHILPRGFVRIRHFGFLVNRCREPMLALARPTAREHAEAARALPGIATIVAMPTLRRTNEHRPEPFYRDAAAIVQLQRQLVRSAPTEPTPCLVARPHTYVYTLVTCMGRPFAAPNSTANPLATTTGSLLPEMPGHTHPRFSNSGAGRKRLGPP